ncbi:DUF998 domain-containing protein [Streptomyces sp. SID5473]|uniref:DUF998 domain-containing protein n=2 Tax=Streptomyces TaxID=1883 RepID=A0A7G3UKA5_STRT9|nr:DUF998 domain-containing protein [Streptomyces sp. SID5473]QKM69815.1 DUF998 domain-containing protein [Streptomyces tsukubensis NRRL18488]TAI46212.1 DUF998 domain-containing protein [Streptomyces tsukubensis]
MPAMTLTTTAVSPAGVAAALSGRRARAQLAAGAAAGPLWAVVSLAQAAVRDGYDITRHPLSMLANGSPGWIQTTNFVVAGLLSVAGAAGLRRALRGRPGGTWAPVLLLVHGVGMVLAGVFTVDPGDGFAGTPAGAPQTISAESAAHLAAGSLSFLALIAGLWVLGRYFSRAGERGFAMGCRTAGTALLLGNVWAMSGSAGGSLAIAVGGIVAMVWASVIAGRLSRGVTA